MTPSLHKMINVSRTRSNTELNIPAEQTSQMIQTEVVPSATVNVPVGILTVFEPPIANLIELDIVFVHGLTGHRERTWTVHGPQVCFWPKDLLPDDFSTARVMRWGYNAGIPIVSAKDTISANRIHDHAVDLCNELARVREDVGVRCPSPSLP